MNIRLSIKIKADVNYVIIGKQHAESVFFTVQFNILLFSLCGALERSHINNVSKNMQIT